MRTVLVCLGICLISCRNQPPPVPTEEQSAQLNEAEDMLNDAAGDAEPVENAHRQ